MRAKAATRTAGRRIKKERVLQEVDMNVSNPGREELLSSIKQFIEEMEVQGPTRSGFLQHRPRHTVTRASVLPPALCPRSQRPMSRS